MPAVELAADAAWLKFHETNQGIFPAAVFPADLRLSGVVRRRLGMLAGEQGHVKLGVVGQTMTEEGGRGVGLSEV